MDTGSDYGFIEKLFEQRKRFERFAMLYVTDPETARDIMMDSFRYVWERRHSIDTSGNIEAYMFCVVRNKCLDHLQREQTRRRTESDIQNDAEFEISMRIATLKAFDPQWLYDEDTRAQVAKALSRLPEKTRRIFLMSRQDEMTYQQIADTLGLSVKTVEFHISKALKSLRRDLGPMITLLLLLFADNAA